MNEFPVISGPSFTKTREQYHIIAQVIGKIRKTLVKPIAKNDNLWLIIVDEGFCLPQIEDMNNLVVSCNMETVKIEVEDSRNRKEIDLNGKTVIEIGDKLKIVLKEFGKSKEMDFSDIMTSQKIEMSIKDSHDFLTQLFNYHWLLKEFHSRIRVGVKTQICLWPHHFDNAFKWFSGRKINEQDEQMGIGVSNGDESYSLPYIYMTFWPSLNRINKLEIIDGALLHDSSWTGLILPYESIINYHSINEQKKLVEDFFDTTFESGRKEFSKR